MTILQMPVRQLGLLVNSIARGATCGMRLFGLLDLELAVKDKPNAPEIKVTEGTLRFDHVSFRYPGTTRDVLKDVSFEAKRGETIALVGPPGSGKSSLVHLIPRYYDVAQRHDHHRRAERRRSDARIRCAGRWRWCSRIRSCSRRRSRTTSPTAIRGRRSGASSARRNRRSCTITWRGCPAGYDTIVGERGVSLSGGQRQRLTIARSLVLKPAVMVFDDSTAAIDAGTEQRIRLGMRRYADGTA